MRRYDILGANGEDGFGEKADGDYVAYSDNLSLRFSNSVLNGLETMRRNIGLIVGTVERKRMENWPKCAKGS